jgi:opacity protein-like surface antigen
MHATTAAISVAAVVAAACSAPRPADTTSPAAAPAPAGATGTHWQDAYDLDGDGLNDRIITEFTGGGHCCYRIGVALSTGGSTVLPFDMDGGYPRGLDLSRPDRFAVRIRPGGLPEIVYQIATYNGEPQPLEPEAAARWKIRSHRIAVCFAGGAPQVRDEVPDLPACKR